MVCFSITARMWTGSATEEHPLGFLSWKSKPWFKQAQKKGRTYVCTVIVRVIAPIGVLAPIGVMAPGCEKKHEKKIFN